MENLINKIHNCDNREILKQLPDKSVQVFLEDMPYGITACEWDKMPDLKEYWDLRLSKLKDNGCFVLFGSEPFSSYLRTSNIKMYKYDWIWNKKFAGAFALAKYQPMKIHEVISIFGKTVLYNPQMIKRNNPIKNGGNKCKSLSAPISQNSIKKDFKKEYLYKFPESIYNLSSRTENNQNNKIHPTQKPVALFEYLIKTYSDKNDLIFDGFSGSGTTAIACYNTNRNFICCELEKEYYDKSVERLNIELQKNKIF